MNIRKQYRIEEGQRRQAAHDALTVEQKIAKAESRRGESRRELKMLRKQLEKAA